MNDDRPLMRSDVELMLTVFGQELLGSVLELVGASPAAVAAVRKGGARPDRDDGVDPQFIGARAVILGRPMVTFGADPGRRTGPGVFKVSRQTEDVDDQAGPASRAIARRKRAREGR